MKRLHLALLVILLCGACGWKGGYSDGKSIVVIFDNDVHCAIDAYPRYAGYRDAVREAESYSFIEPDGNPMLELNENSLIEMVEKEAGNARRDGADYVVVLSHLGEVKPSVTSRELISATSGIDVLLDGHSHSTIAQDTVMNRDGRPVITSQTGTGFRNLGKLVIGPDGSISTELVPIESNTESSEKVSRTVDSVKALYQELAQQKIGTCEKTLSIYDENGTRIVRNRECAMGILVADT